MKTSRYSDPNILSILRQADGGMAVPELCHEHGMSSATRYKWRAKFSIPKLRAHSQQPAATTDNAGDAMPHTMHQTSSSRHCRSHRQDVIL